MSEVPPDLHAEPGKWFPCLFLTLAALLLTGLPYLLSYASERPAAAASVHKVSLLRELPSLPPPPPPEKPKPKPKPKPAAPAPEKPEKREQSVAEIALKEVQASIAAQQKKREDEAKKKKKREEEKKKREAAEKKKREEEKKKKEEEEKRKEEEERKRREEEAKRLKEKEAEEKARAAEARAAELRAQADAEAQAAEAARLAGLKDIYGSRIKLQIERQLETPLHLLNRDDIKALVEVRLHPDGELRGWPKITRSSGFPEYDEAAIRAVVQAAPLLLPSDEPELLREFLKLNLLVCNDPDSPHCRR